MVTPFPAYQGDEPHIFVSYAHEDSDVVFPEIQWLNNQGFQIWFDEGISPGHVWIVYPATEPSKGRLRHHTPACHCYKGKENGYTILLSLIKSIGVA